MRLNWRLLSKISGKQNSPHRKLHHISDLIHILLLLGYLEHPPYNRRWYCRNNNVFLCILPLTVRTSKLSWLLWPVIKVRKLQQQLLMCTPLTGEISLARMTSKRQSWTLRLTTPSWCRHRRLYIYMPNMPSRWILIIIKVTEIYMLLLALNFTAVHHSQWTCFLSLLISQEQDCSKIVQNIQHY